MTQSFNIPDSISPEALEEHLKTAAPDEHEGIDLSEDLFDQSEYWVTRASSGSDNPIVVHKLMMVYIIDRMIQFHECVAERIHEEDGEVGAAWLKDAGKFQAIMNILQTIECGPDDPMCPSCGGRH